jgi:MFS family permease
MNTFLYLNRFATSFADFGLMFLIPLFVFQTTGSAQLTGLAFMAEYLVKVFFSPIAGLCVDRYPLVRLMTWMNRIRAMVSLFVAFSLMLVAAALEGASSSVNQTIVFILILILAMVNGFGFALNFMAQETLLTEIISPDRFKKAQAQVQSLEQVALVTAPIVFSTALTFIDFHWLLICVAIVFVLANLFLKRGTKGLLLHKPTDLDMAFKDRLKANLSVARQYLVHSKPLQRIVLSTFLINLIFGTLLAIGAPAVIGYFDKDASDFASLQTAGAVAAIGVLMGIVRLSHRFTPTQLGFVAFVFMSMGGLIAGTANQFEVFVLGSMLILGFDGMFNVYIRTRRMEVIARKDYGKVMGLLMVVNNVSKPLSGFVVFSLSYWFSVLEILIFSTVVAIILILSLRLFNTQPDEGFNGVVDKR